MALGLFPDPVDKQTRVEIGAAKQGIDMLVMLEEKTKGNLDEREAKFLTMLLTQLRMLFVDRVKELSQSDSPEAARLRACRRTVRRGARHGALVRGRPHDRHAVARARRASDAARPSRSRAARGAAGSSRGALLYALK